MTKPSTASLPIETTIRQLAALKEEIEAAYDVTAINNAVDLLYELLEQEQAETKHNAR